MTNEKIPKSIKEIINLFLRFKYQQFTYKAIASFLKIDINAAIQRVKRNEEYFDITDIKPHEISLKKGKKEIYFLRDGNQCQICRKTFSPDKLKLKFKNPHMKDKYDWGNTLTSCVDCINKEITKRRDKHKKVYKETWEYKEIFIKFVEVTKPYQYGTSWNSAPEEGVEDYYEFDELNGQGWFSLTDDNDEISSFNLQDILNYFGEDGWELIDLYRQFDPNMEYGEEEKYHCIFKRKFEEEVKQ